MNEQQEQKRTKLILFYSYADKDEYLFKKLETHLSPLLEQGIITEWHKGKIVPGTNRSQAINVHLTTAQIILLLISADFLSSDHCYGIEMNKALERQRTGHAIVIPVLLRSVDWKGAPFAHLECLPRNGKAVTRWRDRDYALAAVVGEIRAMIASFVKELQKSRTNISPPDRDQLSINNPPALLMNNANEQTDGNAQQENPTSHLLQSRSEFRRCQRKVIELKTVHHMLQEIEVQLEAFAATFQIQLIVDGDKEVKVSLRWPFIKKEVNQILINSIKGAWKPVQIKIGELKDFAVKEMNALEEEPFFCDNDRLKGPLWITQLFELQRSFEANMREQNVEEMKNLVRVLFSTSLTHLYEIDKQLVQAVEELDIVSDYILRNIQ